MTYRVLGFDDLQDMNPIKHAKRWQDIVEGALNYMEKQGYVLVAIEADAKTGNPLYVLHNG